MPEVFVSGAFDDLRSRDVRFLQEAARLGPLTVLVWSDEIVLRLTGSQPEFPQAERLYMLNALRWVGRLQLADWPIQPDRLDLPDGSRPGMWAVTEIQHAPAKQAFCATAGIAYRIIPQADLQGFPAGEPVPFDPARKKVIVTGCFDWLHSGHIRFFEQASAYGDLYVSLGNDANIRQLKGAGHPLLSQQERAYMVSAIRYVKRAFVAAGFGMLDAAAEIERLRPDIYLVNQDGDKPEKRDFCAVHALQYIVLERHPREGLPSRQSTHLRGF